MYLHVYIDKPTVLDPVLSIVVVVFFTTNVLGMQEHYSTCTSTSSYDFAHKRYLLVPILLGSGVHTGSMILAGYMYRYESKFRHLNLATKF